MNPAIPSDGSPVPGDRRIMRLFSPPKDFVPDGWRPTHQEFQPSSEDKRRAPVRVSVWDETLTSVEQALAFRRVPALVMSGVVESVLKAGASAVVYDPLESPESTIDGASGHAGIEGLERVSGEERVLHSGRLQKIADCFAIRETS